MDTFTKTLKRMERDMKKMKLFVEKQKKPPVKKKSIEKSKSKAELTHFTVNELFQFTKKNKINTKKTLTKLKSDLIDTVWKHLDVDSDSSDSSDSDSDSDSD